MSTFTNTGAVRLPYLAHGREDGIPLVLLHGLSDSGRSYRAVMERLPESIRAYAPTLRGHGDAPKPEHGYEASDLAGDVIALLDELGVERAVVAGHSMGTIVAIRAALDAPERIAGLVLMGGRPTFDVPGLAPLFDELRALDDPVDRAWIRDFQESTLVRPIPRERLDDAVAESAKLPARVWRALADGTLRADHTAELAAITAPTLVVCGERDDITPPASAEELARTIPGARLSIHAGGGHAFHWEDPGAAAAELAAFAARTHTGAPA